MLRLLPKPHKFKQAQGHPDHVDAWLMSYADMITLLCMFFVIFVSITYSRYSQPHAPTYGGPQHDYLEERSGALATKTHFEKTYEDLVGVITSQSADESVAVEKSRNGLGIDMAGSLLFAPGSSDITADQLPLLKSMAQSLAAITGEASIEVAGHTADEPPPGGSYADSWQLSATRAARVAAYLIESGVDPARIRATGYADMRPAVPNRDELGNPITENQRRNERVTIRIEPMPLY